MSRPAYRLNATAIAKTNLDSLPNIKIFLDTLTKHTEIKVKHVSKYFNYDTDTHKNRDYFLYGIFMSYFIRKHLSNQLNIKLTDWRTELILNKPFNYIFVTRPDLHKAIKKHYEIYTNTKTKAMDIIKSIKIVALSESIIRKRNKIKTDYYVNEENLSEIIEYLEKLPYKMADLNPKLGCKYFLADADLIFDNDVIYDIRPSGFRSLSRSQKLIPISEFYDLIISGFGWYKKTHKMIKKFKIYNPLRGYEYSIEFNDIEVTKFELLLQEDLAAYYRLKETEKDNNENVATASVKGKPQIMAESDSIKTMENENNNSVLAEKDNVTEISPSANCIPLAAADYQEPKSEKVTLSVKVNTVLQISKTPTEIPLALIDKKDPKVFHHYSLFEPKGSKDAVMQNSCRPANNKANQKPFTDRIRKWERSSPEDAALLKVNRRKSRK